MVKTVGGYELGEVLGKGSFSTVRKAIHQTTRQVFAVKIIDKQLLVKENMEAQLKREIAVMKGLKHENVMQLVEVLQTTKNVYIVLELVTGGELFEKIVQSKKIPEDLARKYFQQLVFGLYYCHVMGIAHRDLKPENLLLDDTATLKISDFGLSNLQRQSPSGKTWKMVTCCGTPNYVAPEVLREAGYNGFKADVWSSGVILFVMCAGYLPFHDAHVNKLFAKISKADYTMCPTFTDQLKDLIGKMLDPNPDTRITLEQLVNHSWFTPGVDQAKLQDVLSTQPTPDAQERKAAEVAPGANAPKV